jgi:hypothetical protein
MKKILAVLLIICAIAMVFGIIINVPAYWFAIDMFVIAVCGFSGIYFLFKSKKEKA